MKSVFRVEMPENAESCSLMLKAFLGLPCRLLCCLPLLIFLLQLPAYSWKLVPKPWIEKPEKGICKVDPTWKWTFGSDSSEYLQHIYNPFLAWADSLAPGYFKPVSAFDFALGEVKMEIKPMAGLGPEGYELRLEENRILLQAPSQRGIFYGLQTLRQLIFQKITQKTPISKGLIKDKPRFSWRGMHLDVSRHFFSVREIKTYLDMLALHKMNVFHWHLTDDQGWRLEIKAFPKLTEIGAWRKETMIGHYYDKPRKFDGKPHGGFYTQKDVRDLVAYAAQRMITIVPEIEVPGHCQEMVAAYPELGSFISPDSAPQVMTTWGGTQHILNPFPPTLRFLESVLDEVMTLFPSAYIHVGGDEAIKTQWKKNPAIQKFKDSLGLKTERELQSWMIRHLDRYLTSKGRKLMGWDEILEGGLAENAAVMSWRGEKGGIAAAKMKHSVVMSPGTHCYFDKYQVADKTKEPLAIGGFIPLNKVYEYEPQPALLSPKEKNYVLGAQGNVWTEYIPDFKQVQYMALPRMAALAEVVWTPVAQKNFGDFKSRQKELNHWYSSQGWTWCKHGF